MITNPLYNSTDPLSPGITTLNAQVSSYDEALSNSKALGDERDKLTKVKNAISTSDLAKIQKLLPSSIDNIRLILEIGQIAKPYGMVLKDVKYNSTSSSDATKNTTSVITPVAVGGTGANTPVKDYGVWNLSFSTIGTYSNFLNFTKDLENNLRIVDISSVQFSSVTTTGSVSATPTYKYDFEIKTYWLKN